MHKTKAATPLLTGIHEKILKEAIYPYHLLTARQITRFLHPTIKLGNLTTIQTRLKALTEAGYLTAAHLPTVQGVRPFVYCLSSKSRKVLREEGMEAVVSFEKAGVCQEFCGNSFWSFGKRSANSTVNRLSAGFQ